MKAIFGRLCVKLNPDSDIAFGLDQRRPLSGAWPFILSSFICAILLIYFYEYYPVSRIKKKSRHRSPIRRILSAFLINLSVTSTTSP